MTELQVALVKSLWEKGFMIREIVKLTGLSKREIWYAIRR